MRPLSKPVPAVKSGFFFTFTFFLLHIPPALGMGSGIYGGLNLANFNLDEPGLRAIQENRSQKESKPSYAVGTYLNFDLFLWHFPTMEAKKQQKDQENKSIYLGLSVQSEIFYTSKGALYKTLPAPSGNTQTRSRFHAEYIEFPLLLKAELGFPAFPVNLYLSGGASLSVLQRSSRVDINISNQRETTFNLRDSHKTLDVNILLGGGVAFSFFSQYQVFIEARYGFGLLNALKNPTNGEFLFHRNLYLLIGVGVLL